MNKHQIKKYNQLPEGNIMEENVEEDGLELEEPFKSMSFTHLLNFWNSKFFGLESSLGNPISKYITNKDEFEQILTGNKDHNNIYIAKQKQSHTKYGKFMDIMTEK